MCVWVPPPLAPFPPPPRGVNNGDRCGKILSHRVSMTGPRGGEWQPWALTRYMTRMALECTWWEGGKGRGAKEGEGGTGKQIPGREVVAGPPLNARWGEHAPLAGPFFRVVRGEEGASGGRRRERMESTLRGGHGGGGRRAYLARLPKEIHVPPPQGGVGGGAPCPGGLMADDR